MRYINLHFTYLLTSWLAARDRQTYQRTRHLPSVFSSTCYERAIQLLLPSNDRFSRWTWNSRILLGSTSSSCSTGEPLGLVEKRFMGRMSFLSTISVKAVKGTQRTNPNQCQSPRTLPRCGHWHVRNFGRLCMTFFVLVEMWNL